MSQSPLKVAAVIGLTLALLYPAAALLHQAQPPTLDTEPEVGEAPLASILAPVPVKSTVAVTSDRDGVVPFVGVPLSETAVDTVGPRVRERLLREGEWIKGTLGHLVVEEQQPLKIPREQWIQFADEPAKTFRLAQPRESLTPGMVRLHLVETYFRKLNVGDRVAKDQVLVVLDLKWALDEVEIKVAGFAAAETERRAAEKTRDEAKKEYDSILRAHWDLRMRLPPRRLLYIHRDDLRDAEWTWQCCLECEIAMRASLRQAEREIHAALTELRKHERRSPAAGVIRKICKQPGDAVKALEPILQIECDEEP